MQDILCKSDPAGPYDSIVEIKNSIEYATSGILGEYYFQAMVMLLITMKSIMRGHSYYTEVMRKLDPKIIKMTQQCLYVTMCQKW